MTLSAYCRAVIRDRIGFESEIGNPALADGSRSITPAAEIAPPAETVSEGPDHSFRRYGPQPPPAKG